MAKRDRKIGKKARQDRQAGGSDMRKFYWILAAVAVIGIGVVGYSVGSSALGNAAVAPVEVEGLDDPQRLVELAQGVTLGDEDAPITIVEFGDYQCPGCGNFARVVKPQIQAGLVDTGEARFVFYDYPIMSIHSNAFLASRAGRCAEDQDRFWEYHDKLFAEQGNWAPMPNPAGDFVDYAEEVGLDRNDFEACLQSDRHADVVTANMRLGEELGVRGTPTVMVSAGGMYSRAPNVNYQAIRDLVDDLQEQAGITGSGGGADSAAGQGAGG